MLLFNLKELTHIQNVNFILIIYIKLLKKTTLF